MSVAEAVEQATRRQLRDRGGRWRNVPGLAAAVSAEPGVPHEPDPAHGARLRPVGGAVEQAVEEALRGSSRAQILRLPDGQFAPKGMGRVLRPGDSVSVPHRSGKGTVVGEVTGKAKGKTVVRLDSGPDKGSTIHVAAQGAPKAAKVPPKPKATVSLEQIEQLGLNDWPKPSAEAKRLLGGAKDTRGAHTDASGAYTLERKVLHDKIVAGFLRGKTKPRGRPQALFMAGGAASGKTSALKANPGFAPPDAVEVNPDAIKELLPEYQELIKAKDRSAAAVAHEESSDLAKRLLAEAQAAGLNVLIDGTGDSKRGKFQRKLEKLDAAGYDVRALYVTVPTEVAVERAVSRAQRTGRFVPVPEVRSQHRNVSAWFDDVAGLTFLRGLEVYDTSTGGAPLKVASAAKGKLTVHDRAAYKTFRDKGKEKG